jgi:uncharacterized protein with GYD domain
MNTYVVLMNWTDQGIKEYKHTADRAMEAIESLVRKNGGMMKGLHWTIGPYDLVALLVLPDDETLASLLLQVGSAGNVRSMSMRAFDAIEMNRIIERTT